MCSRAPKHSSHPQLLSQAINRELDQKWSSWDTGQHSHGMLVLPTGSILPQYQPLEMFEHWMSDYIRATHMASYPPFKCELLMSWDQESRCNRLKYRGGLSTGKAESRDVGRGLLHCPTGTGPRDADIISRHLRSENWYQSHYLHISSSEFYLCLFTHCFGLHRYKSARRSYACSF